MTSNVEACSSVRQILVDLAVGHNNHTKALLLFYLIVVSLKWYASDHSSSIISLTPNNVRRRLLISRYLVAYPLDTPGSRYGTFRFLVVVPFGSLGLCPNVGAIAPESSRALGPIRRQSVGECQSLLLHPTIGSRDISVSWFHSKATHSLPLYILKRCKTFSHYHKPT